VSDTPGGGPLLIIFSLKTTYINTLYYIYRDQTMSNNPLQKYFRQPKLFVSLPSKGVYYDAQSLNCDASNVPIFAMTGMDEIIMKTPDALFNGQATIKLIESCCPAITDANQVPSLDIDALLIAIRTATYGEKMTVGHTCQNCGSENDFEVNLTTVTDHYANLTFSNVVKIDEMMTVTLRPLSYKEITEQSIENFKLQKMLYQLSTADDTLDEGTKQHYIDDIYAKLAEVQSNLIISSIESIRLPDIVVDNKEFIKEWVTNTARESYTLVKDKLEENKNLWTMPKHDITCTECGTDDKIDIIMDQSSFFVKG
jgi:hypothetical protein